MNTIFLTKVLVKNKCHVNFTYCSKDGWLLTIRTNVSNEASKSWKKKPLSLLSNHCGCADWMRRKHVPLNCRSQRPTGRSYLAALVEYLKGRCFFFFFRCKLDNGLSQLCQFSYIHSVFMVPYQTHPHAIDFLESSARGTHSMHLHELFSMIQCSTV